MKNLICSWLGHDEAQIGILGYWECPRCHAVLKNVKEHGWVEDRNPPKPEGMIDYIGILIEKRNKMRRQMINVKYMFMSQQTITEIQRSLGVKNKGYGMIYLLGMPVYVDSELPVGTIHFELSNGIRMNINSI